jgi:peroxiredoxin
MKITKGQIAPDFSTQDVYNTPIQLSTYKGKKIVVSFFRNVSCPFCNLRVHELIKRKAEFDKQNLQMIFFFESSAKLLLLSSFHQGISPIPLISDPEKQIYQLYAVEASMLKMLKTILAPNTFRMLEEGKKLGLPAQDKAATISLMPADFLIDENFVIQVAHYGQNMADHIAIEDIIKFANSK